jgi:phosphoadenosine phosphosulfate reductase
MMTSATKSKVRTAVLPIAGSITRPTMNSGETGELDTSALRPVVDRPIVAFAMAEALNAGVERLVFVVASGTEGTKQQLLAIADHLRTTQSRDFQCVFVEQTELRGLGHAILTAQSEVQEGDFAVLIPNLMILGQGAGLEKLVSAHAAGAITIGSTERPNEKMRNFGVIEFVDGGTQVRNIFEKPNGVADHTSRASFGRWIFGPQIWPALMELEGDGASEVSLTTAINLCVGKHQVNAVPLGGLCFDLRHPEGVAQASYAYAMQHPEYSAALADTQRDFFDFGVTSLRALAWGQRYEMLTPLALIAQLIERDFAGKIALVSSFGADSAVLLHMISRVSKDTPVLFIDTGKLFAETLAYQVELTELLGLRDIRFVRPTPLAVERQDPSGDLNRNDSDACCNLRKTVPLRFALEDFGCWISGRKRYQNSLRQQLALFEEEEGGRLKVNPLCSWNKDDVRKYMLDYDLPSHPLVSRGYPSIGCAPCTTPVADGEDERAGRWRGSSKTECGIHFVDGKIVRTTT